VTNPWLLGGIAALFGFGALTLRGFERAAAQDIGSKLIGEKKKVSLRVSYPGLLSPVLGEVGTATITASRFRCEGLPLFTEPKRSKKGTIDLLRLDLSDFYLRDLRCERFRADIPSCRFDFALAASRKQVRLSQSGVGVGTVDLLIRDIGPYILKKYGEIKSVEVSTDGDWIRVRGFGQFLVLTANFDVKAKLVTNGSQLLLSDCIVRIDDKEPDMESASALVNALNPVIDFAKDLDLYDAVDAKSIKVLSDRIQVAGRVKIPVSPE
jgi:hypothetical protein